MSKKNTFTRICANCEDFDEKSSTCTIRYLILENKNKTPMPRKPSQKGCEVFMYKLTN